MWIRRWRRDCGTAISRIDPFGSAFGLLQAGDALHAAGQFKQAAQTYRQVATLYPTSAVASRALFQTADSLERADDAEGAQAAFEQAARADSGAGEVAVQAWLRQHPEFITDDAENRKINAVHTAIRAAGIPEFSPVSAWSAVNMPELVRPIVLAMAPSNFNSTSLFSV